MLRQNLFHLLRNRIMLNYLEEIVDDYLAPKAFNTEPDCRNFKIILDVKEFSPGDIEVKVVDNFVVVHGKREEQADQHGLVSREFTKRYQLPADVDGDTIESTWSPDGVLTVYVAKPLTKERAVPVTMPKPFGFEMVLERHKKLVAKYRRYRAQKYAM